MRAAFLTAALVGLGGVGLLDLTGGNITVGAAELLLVVVNALLLT